MKKLIIKPISKAQARVLFETLKQSGVFWQGVDGPIGEALDSLDNYGFHKLHFYTKDNSLNARLNLDTFCYTLCNSPDHLISKLGISVPNSPSPKINESIGLCNKIYSHCSNDSDDKWETSTIKTSTMKVQ